jgi:hypothetical protein
MSEDKDYGSLRSQRVAVERLPVGVHPDGTDWVCLRCKKRYPANYEPSRCVCGGLLTRVAVRLNLHP